MSNCSIEYPKIFFVNVNRRETTPHRPFSCHHSRRSVLAEEKTNVIWFPKTLVFSRLCFIARVFFDSFLRDNLYQIVLQTWILLYRRALMSVLYFLLSGWDPRKQQRFVTLISKFLLKKIQPMSLVSSWYGDHVIEPTCRIQFLVFSRFQWAWNDLNTTIVWTL